jgi:L-asparaginase II
VNPELAGVPLVDVVRGACVESTHAVAACACDVDGNVLLEYGTIDVPVYLRSAAKPFIAAAAVRAGVVERFGLTQPEVAVMCASHMGEPRHLETAASILAKIGASVDDLQCGGAPDALHNNCSGKHAGFLCVACAMGVDHVGYWRPEHAVQREMHAVLEDVTGAALSQDRRAVDGCSVPTWAAPLQNLAQAFAKFGSGQGLAPERARAAARLRAACAQKPWYVAGTGRFCTEITRLLGARAYVKTGAEGVFCGALPELGFGIAIKCDDGAGRAAEAIMAAVVARFLPLPTEERAALAPFLQPALRNWNGIEVGVLRVTEALA